MSCITGCATSPQETKPNLDNLVIKSLPPFPKPSENIIQELKEACPENKCIALHNWVWKILIFEKQMALYKIEP